MIVWILTGFWHGAYWNFIIWGLYFAAFLVLERFVIGDWLKKHSIIARIYVIVAVLISFVIFNAIDITDAVKYIGGMLGLTEEGPISTEFIYYIRNYGVVLVMGIIGATPIPKNIVNKIKENDIGNKILNILEIIFVLSILVVVTAYLVDGSFNPFLYFRF